MKRNNKLLAAFIMTVIENILYLIVIGILFYFLSSLGISQGSTGALMSVVVIIVLIYNIIRSILIYSSYKNNKSNALMATIVMTIITTILSLFGISGLQSLFAIVYEIVILILLITSYKTVKNNEEVNKELEKSIGVNEKLMIKKIVKVGEEDVETLQDLSIETYSDTFADLNSKENLDAYLNDAYNLERLRKEIVSEYSKYYFIVVNDELAGYIKINIEDAQTEAMGSNALEVERIYIKKKFKRQGLGKYLIDFAMNEAINQNKTLLWLGVWEHNEKAKLFYQQLGFTQKGSHSFFMGDDEQVDLIMIKELV